MFVILNNRRMNADPSSSVCNKKRKVKRKQKKNNSKRFKFPSSKIFLESNFDSGDDNDVLFDQKPSRKSDSFVYEFNRVLDLTPSKSEILPSSFISEEKHNQSKEIVISEDPKDISCILTDGEYANYISGNSTYTYDNVIQEFMCHNDNTKDTEIVFVELDNLMDKSDNKLEQSSSDDTVFEEPKNKGRISNGKPIDSVLLREIQCHHTDEGVIVILDKDDIVYLHGLCLLRVLHGEIEVLGYKLTKNSFEQKLYSPRGSSLLYLKNITESNICVTNYLLPAKLSNKVKSLQNCAIVLCKKLEDLNILFIEKHISQQILPKENHLYPRLDLQPKEGSFNLLRINEKWNNIIDKVENKTKLMICGGKGVGKTTFLRYAINKLLMKFKVIRIIDLDPGQSEFTVPGCISLVDIKEPIFGVNYTHLKRPERSILSNINIAYEPDKYIQSVKHLINSHLDEKPTIINYMGYVHGIGINILSAVISFLRPTDILQICSQDPKKNYKCVLDIDSVKENANLFAPCRQDLSYNLYQIESMTDENDGWTAEPRQLREMCTLAFVRQMIKSTSVFKAKAPFYRIKLNDIIISDSRGEKLHPAAVNACLVALCNMSDEQESIFQCFGWGIVRGIDLELNDLVLITSEKLEILKKVTHLVACGATLPPSIYMTPDEIIGPLPYVIEGVLMSFGQITKRSRVAAKSN